MGQVELNNFEQETKASEDVYFPPYSPMDINELGIDLDELHQLLNEEQEAQVIGVNNGNNNNNNGETSMNAANKEVMVEVNVNKRGRRPRLKKGSAQMKVDAAQMKELQRRMKNRETAARSLERKKAYLEGLELQVREFRKKNANLKKLILFMESNLTSNMTQKQLMRTASATL